jgi:hypothetical protein
MERETAEDTSAREAGPAEPSGPTGWSIRPWEGLVLGVLAGALAFGLLQAMHPVFQVPEEFHIAGIGAPVERHDAFRREQDRVDRQHAMLYLGDLGLLLGAALGTRVLAARRAWLTFLLAPLLGLVGGVIGGWFGPLVYVAARDKVGHADLLQIVGAQMLIGVPLGLLLGLGVGLSGGTVKSAIRGGAVGTLGGVLFAILYPLIVAVLLPTANTEVLLPEEGITRLVWLATLGGSVGLLSAKGVSYR